MDQIRATSWIELNEALYADWWHGELGRHRSRYVDGLSNWLERYYRPRRAGDNLAREHGA